MSGGADLPPFVRPLPSLLRPTTEPADLPPAEQAEVDERIEALRWARARAAVTSQSYVVASLAGLVSPAAVRLAAAAEERRVRDLAVGVAQPPHLG